MKARSDGRLQCLERKIVALTLPAAGELARHGIRLVAIAPGIFETPVLQGLP